jgi:hypothetical protein
MAKKRTQPTSLFTHVKDPEFRSFLEEERAEEEAAHAAAEAAYAAGLPSPFAAEADDLVPLTPLLPRPDSPPLQAPPKRRHRVEAFTTKERSEGYRARRTAAGLVQVAYWICASDRDHVERVMTKFTARGRGQYRRWVQSQIQAERQRTPASPPESSEPPAESKFFPNVVRGLAATSGYELAVEVAERTITGSIPAKPTTADRWRLTIELMLALDAAGEGAEHQPGKIRYATDRRLCAWMVEHKVSRNLTMARRWVDRARSHVRYSDLLARWKIGNQALIDGWYDAIFEEVGGDDEEGHYGDVP